MIDYTDPDTIARQNIAPNAGCNIDGKFYDVRNLVHLASSQADRIEDLTKERDAALHLAHTRKAFVEEARDERDAFDAKLTKVVEALPRWILAMGDWDQGGEQAIEEMTATLAEIKGESHD